VPEINRPDKLHRLLAEMERRLHALETVNQLNNATLHGQIIVGPDAAGNPGKIQTSDFDGSSFASPGTKGNYFGKDGAVLNNLYLRPGSVSNTALTNPVRGDSAYQSATNFALTTSGTTPLVSQSWFTPAGFTTANILIVGRVFAYNTTASLDYLFARSRVYVPATSQVAYGTALPLAVSGNNGSGINQSPVSVKVQSLTDGQEIRLEIQGWTNTAGWSASSGNTADVAGQIIWTR
jgi:hypothetical protein